MSLPLQGKYMWQELLKYPQGNSLLFLIPSISKLGTENLPPVEKMGTDAVKTMIVEVMYFATCFHYRDK